jgi:hypothetical protein
MDTLTIVCCRSAPVSGVVVVGLGGSFQNPTAII